MDIDIVGVLIFLWVIFKGLRQGKQAKKEYEENKETRAPREKRARPRPLIQEEKDEQREVKPAQPFPSWFPFPIPIEVFEPEELPTKKRPKPQARSKPRPRPEPAIEKVVMVEERPERILRPEVPKEMTPLAVSGANPVDYLNIDQGMLVNGIILGEILGPPKAKRRIT